METVHRKWTYQRTEDKKKKEGKKVVKTNLDYEPSITKKEQKR